jgi:hypothetical protein
VDFVDEEQAASAFQFLDVSGLLNDDSQCFDARHYGGYLQKLEATLRGQEPCEGGFATPWRPPKQETGDTPRVDRGSKWLTFGEQVRLADHLIDAAWAHSRGEWDRVVGHMGL